MNIRKGILRNSLMIMYANEYDILDALSRIDFSAVDRQFEKELLLRIDEKSFKEVDDFLRSDEYSKYKIAIEEASMSVTKELSALLLFAASENTGGLN
jgi:hypothetical protein